uniref:Uncharacterized protein n=1 Tax=Opuntia streptacantha TaxID=393608 RepID=A0A7C9D1G0_OPUST
MQNNRCLVESYILTYIIVNRHIYSMICRSVIRSRIGPDWTEDRIRAEARTEDWTRQTRDRTGPRHGQGRKPPLFFLEHSQLVLRGTAVPPILFGPPSFFCGTWSARAERHDITTHFIRSTGPDRDRTKDRK